MKWQNQFTKTLGIKYPVIQAPMLGITTPEMVASISNHGGLGSLPVGGLSTDRTRELIKQTKALTDKPFAVNLFTNHIPEYNKIEFDLMQNLLKKISLKNNFPFHYQPYESLRFYSYKEQISCLLEEEIAVVSFTFGLLDEESISALKERNILLIGTATCLKEGQLLERSGIDMIAAQGIEAGGHRGTFLENEPLPQIGLIPLVSILKKHVKIPIIAAGAIHNGITALAAFQLGVAAIQIGSLFIASDESNAIPSFKNALRKTKDTDSIVTRAFSGRWARGIKNKLMDEIDASGIEIPGYPVQNSLTTPLRRAAQQQDNKDFTNLWAGQCAYSSEMKPVSELLGKLILDVETTAAMSGSSIIKL